MDDVISLMQNVSTLHDPEGQDNSLRFAESIKIFGINLEVDIFQRERFSHADTIDVPSLTARKL